MTDEPAPGTGASEDGRTDSETHETSTDGGQLAAVDRIEELEAENEALRERLDQLESKIEDGAGAQAGGSEPADEGSGGSAVSRRGALAAMAGAGVLGLGATGSASAASGDHLGESWSGSVGTGLEITETSASGFTYGVRGLTSSPDGRGVFGRATSSTGNAIGLYGITDSSNGKALFGNATASSGPTEGLQGRSQSYEGVGVLGDATSSSGQTVGVKGESFSYDGTGVYGEAKSSTGTTAGVKGENLSGTDTARGVQGTVGANDGNVWGVNGTTNSSTDFTAGVRGEANATSGVTYGIVSENASTTDGAASINAIKRPSGDKGATYGLKAVNNSTTTDAAAIRAEGTYDGIQVTGADHHGIDVDLTGINADDGIYVDAGSGTTDGVYAECDSDGYWSIWGAHNATSGTSAYGGYFTTQSSDSAAVYANGSGGGAIEAEGDVFVGQGGNVEADGVVRANANASDNVSYLRYRDQTASSGPRTFHNNNSDYIAVRGAGYFDCDMDLTVNRDQTDQRTSGPIAKGYIDGGTSPSVVNAVNINGVSWDTSGFYEVDLAGVSTYDFERYAVNVTQRVNGTPLASRTHFAGDNLTVRFENDSAEAFHLVVWELPNGTPTTSTNDTTPDDEPAMSTDDEITSPDAEPEGS